MKLLITGADGQLGQALKATCADQQIPVIALNRHQLDITDPFAIAAQFRQHQPTVVINAAAYNAVDQAEIDSTSAFAINAIGPQLLAKACAEHGIRLIHISSDYVFAGKSSRPYCPHDPVSPVNQYGQSKLAGERAVSEHLTQHVIVRTAWLYSEFGHNFAKTILNLAQTQPQLQVVAEQRGCPTYAPDLAQVLLALAQKISQPDWQHFGIYHCVGTEQMRWFDFAKIIIDEYSEQTGASVPLIPIHATELGRKAPRPSYSVLDCQSLWQDFQIEPPKTLVGEAIRRLFKATHSF